MYLHLCEIRNNLHITNKQTYTVMKFEKNVSTDVINKHSVYIDSKDKPTLKQIKQAYKEFINQYPENDLPENPTFRLCSELWGWSKRWHVSIHDNKKEADKHYTQAEPNGNEVYIF